MAKISEELLQASRQASEEYGIPTSVILGFAGLETSYGTTGMGKSKNNLFGIGKNSYESVTDSVYDFARLVTGNKDSSQSKKYGEATKNAKTNKEWIDAITQAGYNSEYSKGVYEEKVLAVIRYSDLDQYNDISVGYDTDTTTSTKKTDLVWWGDVVRVVLILLVLVIGVVLVSASFTVTVG